MRNQFTKPVLFLFFLLLSGALNAQTLNVRIIEDAPDKAHSDYIALDVIGIDFDLDFRSSSIWVGVHGRKALNERLAVTAAVRPDLLSLSSNGFGITTEGGAFLTLSSRTKKKDVPVILEYNPFAGENEEGQRIETSKYIKVPGTYRYDLGPRAGVYFKRSGYQSADAIGMESNMTMTGVYVGVQRTGQALVNTLIENDVERVGAGFAKVYLDGLLLPLRTIADPLLLENADKDRFWGVRGGVEFYLDPHDGEYKRLGRTIICAELGIRPYTGFYVNMAWSFAILHL